MTKQSIIISAVAVIILGAVAFFALSKPKAPIVETTAPVVTNVVTNVATTTNATTTEIDQDLNQIDSTNFDKDFESVNQDINGL